MAGVTADDASVETIVLQVKIFFVGVKAEQQEELMRGVMDATQLFAAEV